MRELLTVFNAVQVKSKSTQDLVVNESLLKDTIKSGYILDPNIKPNKKALKVIDEVVGLSGEMANATFHKSWNTIKESSLEDLYIQQVLHYLTTYGFEALGIFDSSFVYIPDEALELPKIKAKQIPLKVVRALTREEILEEIIRLAGSGMALHSDTVAALVRIIQDNEYKPDFLDRIKNRELLAQLRDYYDIAPSDPEEYLRYVVATITDETLLIKNDYLINKIKESGNTELLDKLLKDAPTDLASVFFRYKPIFLALKSLSKNKRFFNRLRRKANKLHKPLGKDYLNDVTSKIAEGELDTGLVERLESASIFRKTRLLHALHYRLQNPDSIVYQVRNGRSWADAFSWKGSKRLTKKAYDIVYDSIVKDLRTKVEGKTVRIPKGVNYALPATQKQFLGNIPSGTYVEVPENIVVGIHWYNLKDYRVDLDLSMANFEGKFGWDGAYRSNDKKCLFSGDITDAPKPNGASEIFYMDKSLEGEYLVSVNYYNFYEDSPVDFKFFVAHEKVTNLGKNYMVDVNNILCSATVTMGREEKTVGMISGNRIIFSDISVSKSITSSFDENSNFVLSALRTKLLNPISFNKLIKDAGARVVTKSDNFDIDLRPESLTKTSFLELLV